MFAGNEGRVLIVDDEVNTLKASATLLKMNGLKNVVTESDSRRVREIMNAGGIDVVILDLFMPNVSGMELLPYLRELHPQIPASRSVRGGCHLAAKRGDTTGRAVISLVVQHPS